MKNKTPILTLVLLTFSLAVAPLPAADEMKMGAGGMDPMTESLRPLKGKDFEVAFLQEMIQHHGSAVDMASLAATNAQSPELKKMAANIITAQKQEIGQMTGWLKAWHNQEPMSPTSMAGMEDMKGHAGMMMMDQMMKEHLAKLQGVKGAEFDRMFLMMMSEHHQGAINMARLVDERTDRADLEKLAKAIITDQEKEIAEMKALMKA